jgi:hypothetical protein
MVVFFARRYAEVIDVVRGDDAPAQFVWRGRHYTVRTVLAHWIRTGAWWQHAAAAVTNGGAAQNAVGPAPLSAGEVIALPPSPRWGQRAWGEPAPDVGVVARPGEVDDDEREFWRVEASIGRTGVPVVVEMCFAWSDGAWTLTGVAD